MITGSTHNVCKKCEKLMLTLAMLLLMFGDDVEGTTLTWSHAGARLNARDVHEMCSDYVHIMHKALYT